MNQDLRLRLYQEKDNKISNILHCRLIPLKLTHNSTRSAEHVNGPNQAAGYGRLPSSKQWCGKIYIDENGFRLRSNRSNWRSLRGEGAVRVVEAMCPSFSRYHMKLVWNEGPASDTTACELALVTLPSVKFVLAFALRSTKMHSWRKHFFFLARRMICIIVTTKFVSLDCLQCNTIVHLIFKWWQAS